MPPSRKMSFPNPSNLVALAICVFSSLAASSVAVGASDSVRPNIVLILVDDLGYSDLGCYGGEIETPNIDRLAQNGVRMTQLYNSARCCPTRASLMTGLYPHQTGVGFMTADNGKPGYRGFLNDRCVTTASLLQTAGYKTYLAGKWHLRGAGDLECTPTNRGFDEFYGPFRDYASFYREDLYFRLPEGREPIEQSSDSFYATNAITDYALHFLDDARKNAKPYYLYLAYNAPHFPLQAPVELIDKYAEEYEKGWDHIREERFAKMMASGLIPKNFDLSERGLVPEVPNRNKDSKYFGQQIPAWDSLDHDRQKDLARRMATFAAMIEIVDRNVGRVVEDLKANGELENTCIFFLSDNGACAEWDPYGFDDDPYPQNKLYKGDELKEIGQKGTFHSYGTAWANASNAPFSSYKHYTYEGGISSPAIVHFPSSVKASGSINRETQHVMDVAATILDLANVRYPEKWKGETLYPIEGQSLLPLIEGRATSSRPLYFEHEGNRGVRDGKWKLVWTNYEKQWELYDIQKDRTETRNIARSHPNKVANLSKQWHAWAERCLVEKEKIVIPSKGMPTIYYNRK
ncbi:MAG: arylsulfatase [Opitutaceae bacterium]|nr:arylsulfatase [Opitutaceae bacterium]